MRCAVSGRTSLATVCFSRSSDSISAVPRNPVEPEMRMRIGWSLLTEYHATAWPFTGQFNSVFVTFARAATFSVVETFEIYFGAHKSNSFEAAVKPAVRPPAAVELWTVHG